MKLSEVKTLLEADAGPIELSTVITGFPSKSSKAISALLQKQRLKFNGISFFDAYDAAQQKIAKSYTEDEVSIRVDVADDSWSKKSVGDFDVVYDAELDSTENSGVYCGFKPSEPNCLYVGIDASLATDEDYHEAFDKKFKREFGVSYNDDNENHEKISNDAWKNYLKAQVFGALLKVTFNGSKPVNADLVIGPDSAPKHGVFYTSIYGSQDFKELGLVDVILD